MSIFHAGNAAFCRSRTLLLAALALFLLPAAAHAQEDNYRYRNLWDLAPGLSYMNTPTGPHLPYRAQLGGADVSATEWLIPRWGATADVRYYLSPGNVAPNPYFVNSPLVTDVQFAGGAEYRYYRSSAVGVNFRALAGGAYGNFSGHVPSGITNAELGLYPNGATFSVIAGPVIDFHRSSEYSIRVAPNYTMTHFGGQVQNCFSLSAQLVLHYGKF